MTHGNTLLQTLQQALQHALQHTLQHKLQRTLHHTLQHTLQYALQYALQHTLQHTTTHKSPYITRCTATHCNTHCNVCVAVCVAVCAAVCVAVCVSEPSLLRVGTVLIDYASSFSIFVDAIYIIIFHTGWGCVENIFVHLHFSNSRWACAYARCILVIAFFKLFVLTQNERVFIYDTFWFICTWICFRFKTNQAAHVLMQDVFDFPDLFLNYPSLLRMGGCLFTMCVCFLLQGENLTTPTPLTIPQI